MNCKTMEDFKTYVQNCSTEELLTLSKDCDFVYTNNYFKEDSVTNAIYGNICDNTEITKAFRTVAYKMISDKMWETVACEVLHRIANNTLKDWKTPKEEIPKVGSLILACYDSFVDIFKVTSQPRGITLYNLNDYDVSICRDVNEVSYWYYVAEIPKDFKLNNYF